MIGTQDEVLLALTYDYRVAEKFLMSRQRLVAMRSRIKAGELSEQRKAELLRRVGATQLREAFFLPAIVRDHKGKFFTECTLCLMVEREEKMKDLHLDKVCGAIRNGQFPNKGTVREILRRKGWTMFKEREAVPSLWSIEGLIYT